MALAEEGRGTRRVESGEDGLAAGRTSSVPVRGTQSFVHTLSACWRRPSLTAIEVGWRWLFGVPALLLVWTQVRKVLADATAGTFDPARLGLDRALVNDPVGALSGDTLGAVGKVVTAVRLVGPGLGHVAVWLLPVLAVAWVVVSSVGRSLVLRRVEPEARARAGTRMGLQALRTGVLAGVWGMWWWLVGRAGVLAVTGPLRRGEEPNLVLYCGMVIVLSLAMFTGWGFVSWVLTAAPLLAQVRDLGVGASLRASLRLGPVRGKLVEINLVLGIVKIALLVLAMVFSATPLPFQDVATAEFLAWWWAGVAVLYLLWSDFFHVARMVGYLSLWRAYGGAK